MIIESVPLTKRFPSTCVNRDGDWYMLRSRLTNKLIAKAQKSELPEGMGRLDAIHGYLWARVEAATKDPT